MEEIMKTPEGALCVSKNISKNEKKKGELTGCDERDGCNCEFHRLQEVLNSAMNKSGECKIQSAETQFLIRKFDDQPFVCIFFCQNNSDEYFSGKWKVFDHSYSNRIEYVIKTSQNAVRRLFKKNE